MGAAKKDEVVEGFGSLLSGAISRYEHLHSVRKMELEFP
jgi:hypothetical protein